jgi:hypothetical protein
VERAREADKANGKRPGFVLIIDEGLSADSIATEPVEILLNFVVNHCEVGDVCVCVLCCVVCVCVLIIDEGLSADSMATEPVEILLNFVVHHCEVGDVCVCVSCVSVRVDC